MATRRTTAAQSRSTKESAGPTDRVTADGHLDTEVQRDVDDASRYLGAERLDVSESRREIDPRRGEHADGPVDAGSAHGEPVADARFAARHREASCIEPIPD